MQLEKQLESRNRKRIELAHEKQKASFKDQVEKTREKSLEQQRKALEDLERDLYKEREMKLLEQEKDIKKKAAADRAARALAEIKERKRDIERMQRERILEVKTQVSIKEKAHEDKWMKVAEERAARAQELKSRNDEKVKQALAKETQNRQ